MISSYQIKGAFALLLCLVCWSSCKKQDNFIEDKLPSWYNELAVPKNPFNYANPELPDFFNDRQIIFANNTPASNPITDWGSTLGRVLFYDKKLSVNNTISCGSCHQQSHGFSDPERFSIGFDNQLSHRHSMGLVNATYYYSGKFFWDERANSLEEQVLMPIKDPIEMGMSIPEVVNKLKTVSYYPELFKRAFGDQTIDSVRISRALAQFVRSMVSYTSKYDEGRKKAANSSEAFINFTASENRGKDIFFNKGAITCSGCHFTDVFIGDNPRNNGLPIATDSGVGAHTNIPADLFTFKTPSLKNIAIRPPYMNNGSMNSLEEVIDHYSDGIADHAYIDPHFRGANGQINQFNLTTQEKIDLIQFLKTLTDEKMLKDEKFGNPFR